MALCLSVCHKSGLNESDWFLAWELPLTYPTLYYKEIRVSPKNKGTLIPSGTLLQTLDLENFSTAHRSSKRVIRLARERCTLTA